MKTISLLIVGLFLSGCAPLLVGAGMGIAVMESRKPLAEVVKANKDNFKNLTYGISKNFVLEIMGRRPFKAYEQEKEITINNPYKIEIIRRRGKTYEVVYYVTDVVKADNIFTDEELTPLVFEQEVLIGWGWPFLNEL